MPSVLTSTNVIEEPFCPRLLAREVCRSWRDNAVYGHVLWIAEVSPADLRLPCELFPDFLIVLRDQCTAFGSAPRFCRENGPLGHNAFTA